MQREFKECVDCLDSIRSASKRSIDMLTLAITLISSCTPLSEKERVLLVDQRDDARSAEVSRALYALPFNWADPITTRRALEQEGGGPARRKVLLQVRTRIQRADALFRELDDQAALDLLSRSITDLAAVHQDPEAIELMARAHLTSAAIFLARGRTTAGRSRLRRALDLDPEIAPSRARFSPRVLSELAALRNAEPLLGRLEVASEPSPATVYLDGRPLGSTPLAVDAPEGRHLLRVSADGYVSHLSSIVVRPDERAARSVVLLRDPEAQQLEALGPALEQGGSVEPTLENLSARGGADRALAIHLDAAPSRRPNGRAQVSVILALERGGVTRVHGTAPADLEAALQRLASCAVNPPSVRFAAPSSLGPAIAQSVATRREVRPWTRRRWVWIATSAVLVGAAASVAVSQFSGGPPDRIDVRVVPRP